eukprot:5950076-Prymnesium_polylepis.1
MQCAHAKHTDTATTRKNYTFPLSSRPRSPRVTPGAMATRPCLSRQSFTFTDTWYYKQDLPFDIVGRPALRRLTKSMH